MITKENITQDEFVCPHCMERNFILIGMQRQKGLFKGHELWKCKSCHGTFARETIDIKRSNENESFNKSAFSYYCNFQFTK